MVVCPSSSVSSADTALAMIEVIRLAGNFHRDGAAVAGGFDVGGHIPDVRVCTFDWALGLSDNAKRAVLEGSVGR